MNSGEKKARIVWRMKSVEVTRVIPSRCAASVAIVDLPVPVAPPTRRTIGSVELLQRLQPPEPAHRPAALGLAEHLDGELGEPVEVEPVAPALRQVGVGPPRELVRARRR